MQIAVAQARVFPIVTSRLFGRIQIGLAAKQKGIGMFEKRCPHCGVKLGNYLYADACPLCHEVLKANLPMHIPADVKVARPESWPVRAFFSIVRFVES